MSTNEWVVMWVVGSLIGLLSLPIFCGRRLRFSSALHPWLYMLGCAVGLSYFIVLGSIWFALMRYRNEWIDFLLYRDELACQKLITDFNRKWEFQSDETKIKFNFEKQRQDLFAAIDKIDMSIHKRNIQLLEQVRRGQWSDGYRAEFIVSRSSVIQ